jgi:hypothetical protein
VSEFLQGGTFVASLAVGLFFLRFWWQARELLFGVLAGAFFVFAANRVLLAVLESEDSRVWVYLSRAAVFALIAAAVVAKNLSRPR